MPRHVVSQMHPSSRRPVVLLLGADPASRAENAAALVSRGFMVEEAEALRPALARLAAPRAPEAALLDMVLPDATLPDALRLLSARHPALVLGVLGAAEAEADEVLALELGADLCLPVPMPPRLAAARLRAALRRRGAGAPAVPAGPVRQGGMGRVAIAFDAARATVRRPDGTEVALTRAEAEILALLIASRGESVSRERLSTEVLGRPWDFADRTVDNLVFGLRRKLGLDAAFGPIRAVRNVGYVLVAPEATA